jgi:hypothetical protein
MCAVFDECIHFPEGSFIEQKINSFAGGQTAFFMLCLNPFRTPTQP